MGKRKSKHQRSQRQRAQADMLREALRRPGVREVMEVYGHWQQADGGLDAYRSATKEPVNIATSDRASIR